MGKSGGSSLSSSRTGEVKIYVYDLDWPQVRALSNKKQESVMGKTEEYKLLSIQYIMDMDDTVKHGDYLNPSQMPYGLWRQKDGREVIFNRQYIPMFERNGEKGAAKIINHSHIDFVDQEFFRDDGTNNPRDPGERGEHASNRCIEILVRFLCGEDLSDFFI